MEQIKLSDILLAYVEFLANPNDANNSQKVNEIVSKIVVRQYLPLEEKIKLMTAIIGCAQVVDDMDGVKLSMNIEIGKLVTGLIGGYCINVENDLDISSLQLSIYDLLYESGFSDTILDAGARRDFERLDRMVDNALNANNLLTLLAAFENFDLDTMDDYYASIDSLKNTLTPETIALLKQLNRTGTPEFDKLTQALNEKVLRETLGSDVIDEYNRTTSFGLATEIENNVEKNKLNKDNKTK